ncbi:MAG TPA: hypothetical protein VJV22_16440 [Acidobacteriaceae bacterium]|nr:hypothetical protein [Acidobacteriaceae bacterium]
MPSSSWEVVFSAPSSPIYALAGTSDGALFAGGGGRVYRALAQDDYRNWTPIVDTTLRVVGLYAFNKASVAMRTAGGVTLLGEVEGRWRALPIAIPDSLLGNGRIVGRPLLLDIWGRSPTDVYAVGTLGTILHFDGARWRREHSPLDSLAAESTANQSIVVGVGGDGTRTFAAGDVALQKAADSWSRIDPSAAKGCSSHAVVTTRAGSRSGQEIIFGGGDYLSRIPCLWTLSGAAVGLPSQGLKLHDALFQGRSQDDGTALFWTYGGEAVEIAGDRVTRIYRLARFREFAGAVNIGDFLYFAGDTGAFVVARVRRR